jgi:crotonobetainyl-CoA:carnitine CoA-transferase CaiB-like acyl-CoA transferase
MMPLEGIRVIDFSDHASGPVCSMALADLGAEVIKIEPVVGEKSRRWGSARFGANNEFSSMYLALNRNKKSIGINIKTQAGLDVARALIESADVVLENMKVGVMDRLGLGYADCAKLNPRLVYCSLTAFGTEGPLAARPGFDLLMQAYAGPLSITGEQGRPAVRIGPSAIDFLTGTHGALGIVAALRERDSSGLGQFVNTSLYESALHLMTPFIADYTGTGRVPQRTGPYFSFLAPYGMFMAKDREFYMGASHDKMWAALCAEAGWTDLPDDPRFRTAADRAGNQDALYEILVPRIKQRTAAEWIAMGEMLAIPCSLIHDLGEVVEQEQARVREAVIPIEGFEGVKSAGLPIKFSRTPTSVRLPPPGIGEHTDTLLAELGRSPEIIAQLKADAAIR